MSRSLFDRGAFAALPDRELDFDREFARIFGIAPKPQAPVDDDLVPADLSEAGIPVRQDDEE